MSEITVNEKTRLNAEIRDAIVANALVSSGVVAMDKTIVELYAAFTEKVRLFALSEAKTSDAALHIVYDRIQAAADGLHGFLNVSIGYASANPGCYSYINANVCGMSLSLFANGARKGGVHTHLTDEDLPCVSKGGKFYPKGRVTIADQAFHDEWLNIETVAEANERRRENIKATVAAAVAKHKTVGKLLEAWPAAIELLPKTLHLSTAVALNPETLNEICGIPTGKQ